MRANTIIDLVAIGISIVAAAYTFFRRVRRPAPVTRTPHGIEIRLRVASGEDFSSTGADLMRIDCDMLGMVYLYGTAEIQPDSHIVPGSMGGPERLLARSLGGWMTMETLHTAAGLVLLQCRPTAVGAAERGN